MMKHHSKLGNKMLRSAKAKELLPGGVWYLQEGDQFRTVISDLENICNLESYRRFVAEMSKAGRIFLRRDKPNYPLSTDAEIFTKYKLKYYADRKRRSKDS